MAALIRAGFDYDVVAEIMGTDFIDDGTDDDL